MDSADILGGEMLSDKTLLPNQRACIGDKPVMNKQPLGASKVGGCYPNKISQSNDQSSADRLSQEKTERYTIHQQFEMQVEKTPNNVAVIFEDKQLTYQELNHKSNQLAHYIRKQYQAHTGMALKADTLIVLCLERSLDMIIAILAVLKAGAAFVPISPRYPNERVRYILKDTKSELLLTQTGLSHRLQPILDDKQAVELDKKPYRNQSGNSLGVQSKLTNLAYVIYTSGTTGHPKGVMVEHGSYVAYQNNFNTFLALDGIQAISAAFTLSYGFDGALPTIFGPFLSGGTILITASLLNMSFSTYLALLKKHKINIIKLTPSLFNKVASALGDYNTDLAIVLGGETLNLSKVRALLRKNDKITLYNQYGPTEAVVGTTISKLDKKTRKQNIGKPYRNKSIYVLDQNLRPVAVGAMGELYIGGDLARGYLSQPKLTKQRFIESLFVTQHDNVQGNNRLYKTGDLVRESTDGDFEFMGRNDSQIKIRGFRIELGEIEKVLLSYPTIQQVCVLAKQKNDAQCLVAYYVADKPIQQESLQTYLAKTLPNYMVPQALLWLESLPLTVNGKLDIECLPTPEWNGAQQDYLAPRNKLERELCSIWASVLNIKKVGVRDDFFELGGNSIIAIQLLYRVGQRLHWDFNVVDFFEFGTIENMAYHIKSLKSMPKALKQQQQVNSGVNSSEKMILRDYYSSVFKQVYNESFVVEIADAIDPRAFDLKLQQCLAQYDVLKSNYRLSDDGFQRIFSGENKAFFQYIDLTNNTNQHAFFDKKINQLIIQPFDIEKDSLIRFYLFQLGSREFKLFVVLFHPLLDASSMINILLPQLLSNQEVKVTNQPLDKFYQFAAKVREFYQQHLSKKHLYWQTLFSQSEPCQLNDLPGNRDDRAGRQQQFVCNDQIKKTLEQLSQRLSLSLFDVLFSAFFLLLYKCSRQPNLIVRTSIDERAYLPQFSNVLGCFINNIFLHVDIDERVTFSDLLSMTHQSKCESIANCIDYNDLLDRFREKVVNCSSIHFNVEPEELISDRYRQSQIYTHSQEVKTDLYFELDVKNDSILGRVEYKSQLFSEQWIHTLIMLYQQILSDVSTFLDQPIVTISLLSQSRYQQIVYDWNKTDQPYPQDKTVCQLFESQAKQAPNNIALVFAERSLTYQQLNQKSNQLARIIRKQYYAHTQNELKPDTLIALCVERSLDMIITILAVLKAGAAYVPIDPTYPKDRIRYILEDTQSQILLTQQSVFSSIQNEIIDQAAILVEAIFPCEEDAGDLTSFSQPRDLAYVLYTSGTTGMPKGVMLEHAALLNRIVQMMRFSEVDAHSQYVFKTNYVFDVAFSDIFVHLLKGASLHITNECFNIPELQKKESVCDSCHFTTSQFLAYINNNHGKQQFKKLYFSGEMLSQLAVDEVIKTNTQVINYYGPTETGEVTGYQPKSANEAACIGKPIQNVRVYILDDHLQPVPIGVVGELYVGGISLARGYLNQPQLTARHFIHNPFMTDEDKQKGYTRLYKTGDLVKWLPDGNIEYIGRDDFQVKLHGIRIELNEIEKTLLTYTDVKQACVLVEQEKYLVAYYVADHVIDEKALIEHLAHKLPAYMIPRVFVWQKSFPLSSTGKLDRRVLQALPIKREQESYTAPRNQLEQQLCAVWETLLDVKTVGIMDDFFKLGGHSLLAIQATYKINRLLKSSITVADLFRLKTIKNIVAQVAAVSHSHDKKVELIRPLAGNTSLPPLYCIHPEGTDCDVYRPLANLLGDYYYCLGIDNYNIHTRDNMASLQEIAKFYLNNMLKQSKVTEPVSLCGWSLGGKIALEIAYWLERRGYKSINVYLLDTVLFDTNENDIWRRIMSLTIGGPEKRSDDGVTMASNAEKRLGEQAITGRLNYTNVTLFRVSETHDKTNDIQHMLAKPMVTYTLPGHHYEIIDAMINEWHWFKETFIKETQSLL